MALYSFGKKMKLIKWLREKHKDLKNLNSLISKKIEEMEKKDIFRQDIKKATNILVTKQATNALGIKNAIVVLAENQKLMNDNQTLDRERLRRLDEKLTEITKMLMGE